MADTARPFSDTVPESGLSRATTIRPIVVFPQPDSPTSPNVSPARTVNDTPDTALTLATRRCRTAPEGTGDSFTRAGTSSRGAAEAAPPGPAARSATARPATGSAAGSRAAAGPVSASGPS